MRSLQVQAEEVPKLQEIMSQLKLERFARQPLVLVIRSNNPTF